MSRAGDVLAPTSTRCAKPRYVARQRSPAGGAGPIDLAGRTVGYAFAGALALSLPIFAARAAPAVPGPSFADHRGQLVQRVAVFGTDDRVKVPARYAGVADRIGLFFSNRSRTVCTAFCVSPNIVATAAHCLAQPGGKPARLSDFMFARGYDQKREFARIEGFTTGSTAQSITTGNFRHRVRPPIDAANDWALIRLDRPACPRGGIPITPLSSAEMIDEAKAGRVFQLSYHRDWTQWRLAYSKPCLIDRNFKAVNWNSIAPDFLSADKMVLHQCDTGGASSGSPMLIERNNAVSAIAINVGTYVQSKIITDRGQVTLREKAETVANTAVNAVVFQKRIPELSRATLLTSGPPLRDLQERLQARRFYMARIDGSYGPILRAAIEDYERSAGLPVTGLATAEILARLSGQDQGLGRVSPTSSPERRVPAPSTQPLR